MSAGWPYRCTGTIAFVFGVIFSSMRVTSMLLVRGSMSTNTTRAPAMVTASDVAMKEFAGTMTSSPGPTPSAMSAIAIASVPLATPTQWPTPQ